jgi:eukaryotic-like serine/threonine-protein kinase
VKICPQCQAQWPDALLVCQKDGAALPGRTAEMYDSYLGSTIDGRYLIEAKLGEGGMGVVYAGRHVIIDKRVAIKVLKKEAQEEETAGQRFIQEAKSASKIGHANIVDITDFGVLPDGSAYFVMEFIEGQTLGRVLTRGPLPSRRVISVAAQIARGLNAAHQKGIVHRDLKPENVFLLERDGQSDVVKIVDFGIAKVQSGFGGGPAGQRLTQVGMVLGTPEYMSPEQATGKETDHRVDEYALGCIMYEMVTGEVPFKGDNSAGTLTKHVFDPVIWPSKRRPDLQIARGLEDAILRAMQKKPEDRFPGMRELLDALDAAGAEIDSGREARRAAVRAAPTAAATQLDTEELGAISGGRRRRTAMLVGVAALVLVGAGVASWLAFGDRSEPGDPVPSSAAAQHALPRPAKPEAPPPTQEDVKLRLSSNPEGAEVFLDGEDLGQAPVTYTHAVATKKLPFLFRLPGYKDATRDIEPSANREMEIALERIKPPKHEGQAKHASSTAAHKGPRSTAATPTAPPTEAPSTTKTVKTAGELRDPF